MKTKLFLLLALMLWGGIAINAQFAHESEPNNTFANATIIGLGDCVTTSIFPKSDEDFFKVDVPSTGVLVVFSNRTPAAVALNIIIYDAAQNVKLNEEQANRYGQDIATETIVNKGTYYIRVRGTSSTSFSSDSMYLCAWFDEVDSFEFNNSFATAAPVSLDKCFKAKIRGRNFKQMGLSKDIDFYKVFLPRKGIASFAITKVPTLLNLGVFIFDKDFKIVANGTTGQGMPLSSNLFLEGGTYYLAFEELLGRTDSNAYEVCISLDTSEVHEINNGLGSAYPVPVDTCFDAKIFGETINSSGVAFPDVDVFSFTLKQGGNFKAEILNVPPDLKLSLILDGLGGVRKKVVASGKGKSVSLSEYLCEGEYFLTIKDEDSKQSNVAFSTCFSFSKDDECGNSFSTAPYIDVCDTAYASLRSPSDRDFFYFVGDGQDVMAKLYNVAPNIRAKIKIYDFYYKFVDSVVAGGLGSDIAFAVPKIPNNNAFYFVVESDNKSTSNTIYRFVVTDDNCKSLPPPPVAVNELVDANAISIFPNPSSGKFFIKIPAGEVSKISISNMLGQVVYSNDFYIGGVISLDEPDGVYFINIHHSNGYITKRLIINN